MTQFTGPLKKLGIEFETPLTYYLRLGEEKILLNTLLNHTLSLTFTGRIYCIQCGRLTKKSFQQGYCFPCFKRLQECGLCIIHPERCLVESGQCLAEDWAHQHCVVPHVVYLANTSGLKVGITREVGRMIRWMDQGAIQALPMFKVSNRYQAGLIEVALKTVVADKTDWRRSLKNLQHLVDLKKETDLILDQSSDVLAPILARYEDAINKLLDTDVVFLEYPVIAYPEKVKSMSFDDSPCIQGLLVGMKGQYLIFDCGVLNIRKFSGYEIVADLR